jgi:asparagine synthase (glutamine-hydrolysing)
VDHIVGDYAFVLWDAVRDQVFAARDHSGVRSLHYAFDGARLVFATEVKQVLAAPGVTAQLFEPAVAGYLAGGYSRPEWTFYEGIQALPPGHVLEVSRRGALARRFWNPDPPRRIRYLRETSYAGHFRELLDEAVRTRIRSPRPVGVLLSGGTDSGSVTSVAANLRQVDPDLTPELRTYSFAFEDLPDSDERAVSDAIVAAHGLPAVPVPGDDAWPLSGFPQYGPERDSPFAWVYQHMMDRSAVMAAADGVGVLLTGEGGDELMGDEVYDLAGMIAARPFRLRREVEALAVRRETDAKRVVKRDVVRPLRRRLAALPGLEPFAPRSPASRPYRAPVVSPDLARRTDLDRLVLDAPKHRWQDLTPRERRRVRLTGNHLPRLLAWQEHLHARHGLGAAMPLADARLWLARGHER